MSLSFCTGWLVSVSEEIEYITFTKASSTFSECLKLMQAHVQPYNVPHHAFIQDAFSGYEFEARLNFKVHSAMALVR